MKTDLRAIMVAVMTLVLATSLSVVLADDQAVRKALDACYASMTKAFQQKDIKAYGAFLADQYELHQPNGKVLTREKFEPGLKRQMDLMTSLTWGHQITKLTVKGDEAEAEVNAKFSGKMKGDDGKEQTLVLDTALRDTWTKTTQGWLLKRGDVLTNTVSVDGKVVGGN